MATKSNKNAINIATWNATGIIYSASYLCDMLIKSDVDICGVSEHWLFKQNLHFLDSINSDYVSYAVSDPDIDTCSNRRVGKGGIALLWHKRMTQCVTILETNVTLYWYTNCRLRGSIFSCFKFTYHVIIAV